MTCPKYQGEFYCHTPELRHKNIKLLCPYCGNRFLDEENPKIVE
ncbi:MAG: hypothetical protein QF619_00660 [Candidatus Binatia bacterium]|nr:hypothetical protein [Candidatus Binatia bacterium]